jgi:hypothetical protein
MKQAVFIPPLKYNANDLQNTVQPSEFNLKANPKL